MEHHDLNRDSAAWLGFVKLSFALAFGTTLFGVWFLPVDLWIRGFMTMGIVYCVGSAFTLSKTIRDQHEAEKAYRMSQMRTARLATE